MFNYTYMLPETLILFVFVLFYFTLPRLNIRMNRTFMYLLLLDVATPLIDYLSSLACNIYDSVPAWFLWFINALFFLLFLSRSYWYYLFTRTVLKMEYSWKCWTEWVYYFSMAVVLSSFFTGAVFFINEQGYQRGPFYNIIYVCGLFYIFLGLIFIFIHRRRVKVRAAATLLICQLILLTGYAIRYFFPGQLVMNMFCLLALIFIYLTFENPDNYLSDRGRAFNMLALRERVQELSGSKAWKVVSFKMRDYVSQRGIYGGAQMDQGINMISDFLMSRYPEAEVFYIRRGCFVLLCRSGMDSRKMRAEIEERFRQPWKADEVDLYLSPMFVMADSASVKLNEGPFLDSLMLALDTAGQTSSDPSGIISSDQMKAAEEQIEVKRALEKAIDEDRVEVFFQPIYDCSARKVVAAEALARIRDEDNGLLSPVVFIPIAERNGYISLLGEQVFRKTCAFIRAHNLEEMGLSWINVNLSPIQCMNDNLAERLSGIIREYDIRPEYIHLEITEQSMIDYSLLLKQIVKLQAKGFQFALDDYGSGYSNLTRVKHYPFINIKLDMEVVWDYYREPDTLLPSLVNTFKQMHLTVTAEGIETEDMADSLAKIGCDYLQGFFFSRPIPMEEFAEKYTNYVF